MFRVHRDFKGLLKAAQDEYDSLVELNESLRKKVAEPDWFWWGQDGCWFCKQRNNCNQCKANREYVKEFGEKKQKGKHASAKRGARTKPQLMEDDYGFMEGI